MLCHLKKMFLVLSFTALTFFAGDAFAQSVAGGGMSAEAMRNASCLDQVRRLRTQITALEDFADELRACNDAGQIYNGVTCVGPAKVEYQWLPDETNPTELVLLDNGVEVTRVSVIKGADGAAATCPAGTQPVGSP